jgi:hypothetical protein
LRGRGAHGGPARGQSPRAAEPRARGRSSCARARRGRFPGADPARARRGRSPCAGSAADYRAPPIPARLLNRGYRARSSDSSLARRERTSLGSACAHDRSAHDRRPTCEPPAVCRDRGETGTLRRVSVYASVDSLSNVFNYVNNEQAQDSLSLTI